MLIEVGNDLPSSVFEMYLDVFILFVSSSSSSLRVRILLLSPVVIDD